MQKDKTTNKTKYKTEWDLSNIYKSHSKGNAEVAKEVAKDCAITKKKYLAFAKKYRKDKKHLKSPKAMLKVLEEYEKLGAEPAGSRPAIYYSYRKALDSNDTFAQAEKAKLSDFYANLANELTFFMLEIGKIDKATQAKYIKSKELKDFKYLLEKVFENAKHNLTEAEEKIINLKNAPAHSMWVSGFSKLLAKQVVEFQGKTIPLAEAAGRIPTLDTKERRELHKNIMNVVKNISDFAESELNAIVTDKKVEDKLRGYKTPYEATVKGYENESQTVKELTEAVTKNAHISHRFYKIKAKILGEKTLSYADRAAKAGSVDIKISFEESVERTLRAFNSADPEFGAFVESMFRDGLVDVFPKIGKQGGAFCSHSIGMPIFVFLNHIGDFRSLTTLAHEMGHALHSKYSQRQRPAYQDYTIATAEVASTFFENLIFEDILEKATDKEKIILLHDKIQDDIATIFRQVACFNFEVEMHERIRKEGFLQKEDLAQLMNKHMQSYLGPVFKLEKLDGYFFVEWPHIRNFFYVYSYAFGQIISSSLYQRYKKDKTKIKDVIKFISAGGSNSPEGIFRSIGINPNKKFFEEGLKNIESDIELLEKLWAKNKA